MTEQEQLQSDRPPRQQRRGCFCRIWRVAWRACLAAVVIFGLAILIGQIPVNRGFRNAEQGVEIFVYADQAHSEIVVPATTTSIDWRQRLPLTDFRASHEQFDHIAFGWGDHDFFIETERWEDLRWGTTLKAMLVPTRTVMHVANRPRPVPSQWYRRVVLTGDQYDRLTDHIWSSFGLDEARRPALIADTSYGDHDAFYEARGRYLFLNTCNNWTGRALKRSGVRTGLWTPFAWGLLQVPNEPEPGES